MTNPAFTFDCPPPAIRPPDQSLFDRIAAVSKALPEAEAALTHERALLSGAQGRLDQPGVSDDPIALIKAIRAHRERIEELTASIPTLRRQITEAHQAAAESNASRRDERNAWAQRQRQLAEADHREAVKAADALLKARFTAISEA